MRFAVGTNNDNGIMTGLIVLTEENIQLFREWKPMRLEFRKGCQVPFDIHIVYAEDGYSADRLFDELCGPNDAIPFLDTNNDPHPSGD